ncbi:MFS transporter [Sphingobium sp. HBC34]|uniref:Multidrug efflux pump Tap n=1 Tax=Sphingobium cyanobacteriorum TaxID=3063954 RepID=A0ABT8ZI57_9SPHN|nr:MFS transporter [Sphingobium sp. HBC34]MDO7833828.1 MFS transporter [Sphingobium sp. HBC34]
MTALLLPRHPLHFANFRAYLVGRLCAVLAQYGMMIVLAWQAYNIARETMTTAGASAQLGLIGLAQFLPLFFLTPLAGWVADHYDRRWVARITLALLMGAAGLLAFATYENRVSLPLIFGIAVIVGTARVFNGPAYGALAPNLVPVEVLPNAIAISAVVWQAGMIAGPALGGYAYAATPWGAYALAAGLFGIALLAMMMIGPVPQPPRDATRHPLRQMIDGFTYVRGNRLVLATITLDLFAVLLAGATALLPVYARDILHVGSAGLGHLAAAPGIGAGATALWFSFRPMKSNVGVKMLASVMLFGLATIAFGCTAFLPRSIAMEAGIVALVVLGSADMVSVFVRQSLVQIHTPDAMRGRVSSLSQLTISASNELGEAESGFLAALVGPVAAVIGGGVGAILITLYWARLFPELRLARSFDPPDIGREENSQEKNP